MKNLLQSLQIGYMDTIQYTTRCNLINSGISVSEVLKKYPNENNHLSEAEETLKWLDKSNSGIVWFNDERFPKFQPVERRVPCFLLYKGRFPSVEQKTISIVGTRNVDNDGFQEAFKLGYESSINEISVVSGLAEGCDQAALCGAVTGKFASFGVLGCGVEYDYPKCSAKLKDKMIECGGGLISRFSPYCPPMRYNFPNRNLIIAAMGDITIVVQAPKRSGSLITTDFALQLGKDVFVSSAGVGEYWARIGSNGLVEDGACVINSLSDYYMCDYKVFESKDGSGVRFGNKHYFFRSLI